MTPQLSPLKLQMRWTMHKLRPPSRKKLLLLESFSKENGVNLGCSYRLESGEPVVASGDGRVISIRLIFPTWKYSVDSDLGRQLTYEVTVDHGNDIWTTVHGLQSCSVGTGQTVERGDVLGYALTDEIFFQIKSFGSPCNPAGVSRHFQTQNGSYAVGRQGYIREAADMFPHVILSGIKQVIVSGIKYFVDILGYKPPFLANIDFNGSSYTGPAVVGSTGDYWNVYVPVNFVAESRSCYCGYGYGSGTPDICFTYSSVPYVYLSDSNQVATLAWLERIAPIVNSSGSTATWNAMLQTWIGGFESGVPLSTVFRLHGLPPGTYELYIYSDQTYAGAGSDYYVQVDSGAILHAALTPTAITTWVQDDNYVLFSDLAIVPGSLIRVEVVGYCAGLQIRRV